MSGPISLDRQVLRAARTRAKAGSASFCLPRGQMSALVGSVGAKLADADLRLG